MIEYTLIMPDEQCHETLKAVELLMRLKLGQYQELIYTLCDIYNPKLSKTISEADSILKTAFEKMNKHKKTTEYKDEEWYRLYNIYQVLRKAIHDAEHPEGQGLDSYEPMRLTEEPLPIVKWIKKGEVE